MNYKSILKQVSVEYIEKKSRFIAYAKPVSSEEEAIEFINEIKSRHWDARHNVYAYCTGITGLSGASGIVTQRYSDDGEPQGTAGIPVLDVLRKNSLTNVVVVVTRYFGGILLGASGLVRAYGKSAALAIESAGIVERILCDVVSINIEYTMLGKLQRELPKAGYDIKEIIYNEKVIVYAYVKKGCFDDFEKYIMEVTNASADVEKCGEEFLVL